MAVKTKALTKAYYGRAAQYAYWDGFSTGGRQGHKLAQLYPDDFDGILAGAGAINWTNFITNELYPMVVIEKELGGKLLTTAQLALLGNAAIAACDDVGGVDLGYIPDLDACHYDPTQDKAVLCVADGGTNDTPDCVSPAQANAVNQIWYGQTRDGSVPAPADDHGYGSTLDENQIWFGLTRGSNLGLLAGASFFGPGPFPIATDMVALELQNPAYTNPGFINGTGNGTDAWKELTYEQLADATEQGVDLQDSFGGINTDTPDLAEFHQQGGKLLAFHGLADELIAPQGSIHYYERVLDTMGGVETVQEFYRLYLIPGMGHSYANGTTNPNANLPLPGAPTSSTSQFYDILVDWVEKGIVPARIDISSRVTEQNSTATSRPICVYPQKATYTSGDPTQASSYQCERFSPPL